MVAVGCTPALGCEPPYQWSLIPIEYQGWAFLIFLVVSGIALIIGFYFIATIPIENTSIDTMEPKKRKLYDKLFFELMGLVMLALLASFMAMMLWR
jgi:hypothetical protein